MKSELIGKCIGRNVQFVGADSGLWVGDGDIDTRGKLVPAYHQHEVNTIGDCQRYDDETRGINKSFGHGSKCVRL